MKSKLKTKDFKLISAKVFLLCLLLAFGSSKAFSQCNYVTTENGKETKLSIPCDFPVMINTGNYQNDKSAFDTKLTLWKNLHPSVKVDSDIFLPKSDPNNTFIEIPLINFNSFLEDEKKMMIQQFYFYKITKTK